jgi:hypothetical protein
MNVIGRIQDAARQFSFMIFAAVIGGFLLGSATTKAAEPGQFILRQALPTRVHTYEDYETEIEKRWWLRGAIETNNLPRSLSASLANTRACRASASKEFGDTQGKRLGSEKAVMFNPVPGPPMGPRPCLSFRYWLKGDDTIRAQIFSLTKNDNRFLILTNLPQGRWEQATIDLTRTRRADGSNDPFSEGERIDDIQFYVRTNADLIIDDIVLYEAPPETEKRPFPRRIIFTAWFDTGKQGVEWPGDFEIVPHQPPLTWNAAKSVQHAASGASWIRINMRGFRRLSQVTQLRFRYRLTGTTSVTFALANSQSDQEVSTDLPFLETNSWSVASVRFRFDPEMPFADEIRFRIRRDAELLIDDVLLFEPGDDVK